MIFKTLLEQSEKARKAKFAKQINKLIRNTGKLERKKVEEMIRLLDRVKKDILDQMIGLPKGNFTRDMGAILKADIERQMIAFSGEATGSLVAAQEEFAELGAEFTGELIRSQGRRAPLLGIRPELIENAATRSADLIRSLSLKQVGQASDIINRGVISGKSTFEVAQEMRGQFNKGISQMETIARTEMLGIHSQVQIAELEAMALDTPNLKKQWITVIDGRERPDHRKAHLQSVFVDMAFNVGPDLLNFPRDPAAPAGQVINCFLPDTIIQGTFIGGFRAPYNGRCIRIVTASGRSLSVTPNHPVLTRAGFKSAKALVNGNDLICYRSTVEGRTGHQNLYEEPTTIEKAFSSFSKFGTHRQVRRLGDFHGDAVSMQGDIEIVGAVGKLLSDVHASLPQTECNLILESSHMSHSKISSPSSSHLHRDMVTAPTASLPCRAALADDSITPLRFETRPLEPLRFGMASNIHTGRYESTNQSRTRNADFEAQLFHRHPGAVEFDKIIKIVKFDFSGHVYDLQSEYGWIVANNIFASNCRCTMVPDFSEVDDVAPLSEPDIQPVQIKLGGLARKVAGDVKKGFKNLK